MGSGNISRRYDTIEKAIEAKAELDAKIAEDKDSVILPSTIPEGLELWTRLQGPRLYLHYRNLPWESSYPMTLFKNFEKRRS